MLKDSYTFNNFSTNDLKAAKRFYTAILGLKVVENEMGVLEIQASESNKFVIYTEENHQPANFTVINFEVKNIRTEVDILMDRGIVFQQYLEPMKRVFMTMVGASPLHGSKTRREIFCH